MSERQTPRTHISSVDLGDTDLNERIDKGMEQVEELLAATVSQGEPFVVEKISHLAQAGGKRFRPLMALLASQYGPDAGSSNVVKAAAIVELVHLATLYHDDVMDDADRRRGVESANSRWGNSVAILAGDVLLAHVSRLMSQLDTTTVAHFADTFEELVTGQLRETIGSSEGMTPIEHYMAVIKEKTGVLIASAGHLGAKHGGAPAEIGQTLYRIGGHIGTIFQIVDDVIDIYSDAGESGKTPGTDLREGVFTLPVLFALEEEGPIGDELRSILTGPLGRDEDVNRALELLHQSTGRARTREVIDEHLLSVEAEIATLPAGPATEALRMLSKYTVRRVG